MFLINEFFLIQMYQIHYLYIICYHHFIKDSLTDHDDWPKTPLFHLQCFEFRNDSVHIQVANEAYHNVVLLCFFIN